MIVAAQVTRHSVAERLGLILVKGILIMGSPGTGKTLLAKALASAVERTVYVIPAAEMNATLIRRVYERLADTPCVIVWDEADVILRARNSGRATDLGRTVAAFCSALDGVQSVSQPITVALTAESEWTLDRSATRAGRLTTKIQIDLPDRDDRLAIWQLVTTAIPVSEPIDLARAADRSTGMSGADIAATVAVALGLAMVDGLDMLDPQRLDEALLRRHHIDERPVASDAEKRRIAVHEMGHAIAAVLLWGPTSVMSVTVGATAGSDGKTTFADRYMFSSRMTRATLREAAAVALAGMVAEELLFGLGEVSAGSSEDLTRATVFLRQLAADLGGSPSVGPIDVDALESGRDSDRGSEAMRSLLWHALSGETASTLERVRVLLRSKTDEIGHLAERLLSAEDTALSGPELVEALVASGLLAARDGQEPA